MRALNRRGFFAGIAGIAAAAEAAPTAAANEAPPARSPVEPQAVKPFEIGAIKDVPVIYVGGKPSVWGADRKRVEISAEAARTISCAWDTGGPDAEYDTRITGTYRGRRIEGDALIISIVRRESIGPAQLPTWEVELQPLVMTFRSVECHLP